MDEGSISKHRRRDGTIGFRVRLHVDGKRVSYGVYDTMEEAEDKLAAALEQRRASDGSTTLRAWGVRWLDRRELGGQHRSVHQDRARWLRYVAPTWLAAMPVRRITRADLVRFVRELVVRKRARDDRPIARATSVHVVNLVRKALADAADDGIIPTNPATDIRVPRGRGSTEEAWAWLTADEIAALAALPIAIGTERSPLTRARDGTETNTITPAQRAIFTVAIYTGLRAGELWALRWSDVVLDDRRPELVVRASHGGPTKSGVVRRVPLLAPAREALTAWRARLPRVGEALVFPSTDGGRHALGYTAGWRRVRALLGITRRVRFHDLRHTCASHLVQGSWGRAWRLEEVRAMLGHSSVTVTERYAHLAPGGLHDAARETASTGHRPDTTAQVIPIGSTRKAPET